MCRVVGCTKAAGPVSAAGCPRAAAQSRARGRSHARRATDTPQIARGGRPPRTADEDARAGGNLAGGELEGARKGAAVEPREGVDGQHLPAELLDVAGPACRGARREGVIQGCRAAPHARGHAQARAGTAAARAGVPQLVRRQGRAEALDAHASRCDDGPGRAKKAF